MKPNVFVPLIFLFLLSTAQAATVTKTTITQTSVTPTSAPAGTMFKFTADLSNPLPTGYKIKITFGKGFTEMIGTNQSYSLSRAIFTTGKQTYKIAIINSKNVIEGVAKNSSYTVTSAAPVNHAPTLALIKAETSAIANTAYTVTLNAKDVDANLNAITLNWGDNSEPETLTATDSKDLVFNHTYATASSFGWNASANDKGTPALKSTPVSKIVTVSNPVPVVVTYPVTEIYDEFKKITSYSGVMLKVKGDKTDMTDLYDLIKSYSLIRAWKFSDNSIAYQFYISSVFRGDWRFYNSTWDSNGNSLDTTQINRDVSCNGGCTFFETVGANITREYLQNVKDTGIKLKISGSAGEEIFQIPADYIKAILAAVPAS